MIYLEIYGRTQKVCCNLKHMLQFKTYMTNSTQIQKRYETTKGEHDLCSPFIYQE